MRKFLCQDNGFKECEAWCPHCWVNIENPDMNDINFLLGDLHMPTAFIESITDNIEYMRLPAGREESAKN